MHRNGKEALQHFDWISERIHTVKSYDYSLPSVSLQPSRLALILTSSSEVPFRIAYFWMVGEEE